MAKTKLFKFNIKNVKYAIKDGTLGTFGTPTDLAYADSISLEADYEETKLYGDGQILAVLADDKGKTGSLSVVNIEKQYEIDMKRSIEIDGGLAEVQQRSSVDHAIYFEVDALSDGTAITIKRWLYGVTTGKASESYNQTTDNPTINTYEYPLTILGVNLKKSTGSEDFVDENGNTVKVFSVTSFPEDEGYATFGSTVPIPKAKTEIGG